MYKKENRKFPESLEEDLKKIFESCWEVNHFGPEAGESYFTTDLAITRSMEKIKNIALEYNDWFNNRLLKWIDTPSDFPEMEEESEKLYNIFLSEKYKSLGK